LKKLNNEEQKIVKKLSSSEDKMYKEKRELKRLRKQKQRKFKCLEKSKNCVQRIRKELRYSENPKDIKKLKKLRKRRNKETKLLLKQQTDLFACEYQKIEQSCGKVSNQIFQNTAKTIFGKNYTIHALDRMNKRNISFYSVENAINQGTQRLTKDGSWSYKFDNVIVVMNKDNDNILTTYWDF